MFIRNYVMSPQLDANGNPIGGLTGFCALFKRRYAEPSLTELLKRGKAPAAPKHAGKKIKTISWDAKPPSSTESMSSPPPKKSGKINTNRSSDSQNI